MPRADARIICHARAARRPRASTRRRAMCRKSRIAGEASSPIEISVNERLAAIHEVWIGMRLP